MRRGDRIVWLVDGRMGGHDSAGPSVPPPTQQVSKSAPTGPVLLLCMLAHRHSSAILIEAYDQDFSPLQATHSQPIQEAFSMQILSECCTVVCRNIFLLPN